MYQVIKRDGRRVDFDLTRISNAITKAFDAAEIPYNTDIINLLALQVTADYAGKVKSNAVGVEDIQDSVEAGEGKFHRHLLRGWADPIQLRCHHRQLLAQRDLRRGD